MKKSFGILTTVSIVLTGSLLLNEPVQAETLEEIQDERSAVKADLSETEAEIADVMMELEDLNNQIERVDEAQEKNKQKMEDTKDKITDTKNDIPAIEEEVSVLEDKIDKRKGILKDRIVSLQKSGGDVDFLEVIFGAESFGDMISRVSAVSKIAESDEMLMKQQQEDKAELEEKKASMEEKLSDLKAMKVELAGMEETIQQQQEQNKADKKELKQKEQNLKDMKAELVNKDSSLSSIEQGLRQRDTENSSADNDNESSSNNGDLKQLSQSQASDTSQPSSAGSGGISKAISAGHTQKGTPYVVAGKGPGGFDCSGFVSWAFGQAGVSLPSSTAAMQHSGEQISYSNIQRGDLVFFDTYKKNGHVGIYLGNGKFLGAQNSTGVAVADMNNSYWSSNFNGHVRRIQ